MIILKIKPKISRFILIRLEYHNNNIFFSFIVIIFGFGLDFTKIKKDKNFEEKIK